LRSATPDTNLYISALLWGGKPKQLLQLALAGKVRLFISDAIMDEMLEVLETKFEHSPKRLAEDKEYIASCTVRCVPKIKLNVVPADEDDNWIVECAVHSRSETIVTNDKDLLRLKEYQGIRIIDRKRIPARLWNRAIIPTWTRLSTSSSQGVTILCVANS